MSTKSLIALFVGALVALQAGCCACAPSPVISSVNQGKESLKSQAAETQKPLPILAGEAQINLPQQQQANANVNLNGLSQTTNKQQQAIKINNADKLKRSLTSFMNQLNPASFFVPASVLTSAQQQQQVGKGEPVALVKQLSAIKTNPQTTAETAAIVNGYPTVDVLIKGPNRSFQTRPIGGPLRWG